MIVYGSSLSPFVRKVLVALIEKGVAFDHKPINPRSPDPGFLVASPMRKMPAFVDEDFRLADSSAIVDYIERRYPEPALIPIDAREAARARWFDKFAEVELHHRLSVVFFERFLKPHILKIAGDEALAQRALDEDMPPLCDYLESEITGSFLVGNAFGLADIAVAAPFHNLRLANVAVDATRWPKLAAWLAETLQRPSFVTAMAAA